MRRVTKWGALIAIGLSTLLTSPPPAEAAGAKVSWVRVDVPARQDAARVQKLLKQALVKAARKASFGKAKSVSLSARVVELSTEERGDIVRITCTVMGRVVGGAGARS